MSSFTINLKHESDERNVSKDEKESSVVDDDFVLVEKKDISELCEAITSIGRGKGDATSKNRVEEKRMGDAARPAPGNGQSRQTVAHHTEAVPRKDKSKRVVKIEDTNRSSHEAEPIVKGEEILVQCGSQFEDLPVMANSMTLELQCEMLDDMNDM